MSRIGTLCKRTIPNLLLSVELDIKEVSIQNWRIEFFLYSTSFFFSSIVVLIVCLIVFLNCLLVLFFQVQVAILTMFSVILVFFHPFAPNIFMFLMKDGTLAQLETVFSF